jgi:ribose/xylose/arabinose/galactoside ABC-type transport system permease subunit
MSVKASPEEASIVAKEAGPDRGRSRRAWMQVHSALPVLALVVLVIVFTILRSDFLSSASIQNIMRQTAFLAMLALAGTTAILIGAIDLSVAANATLGGILIAKFTDPLGFWPAVVAALAICGVAGLVNSFAVIRLRVPSFLVTLGMLSILDGVSNEISQGSPQSFNTNTIDSVINSNGIPGVPNAIVITVVIVILMTIALFFTKSGRYVMSVGGNERAALLAGVPVNRIKVLSFVLGGILAGVAGIIFTGQALNGVPEGADPSLLSSIAAIVVGGTALSGGVGGPHRTLLGALVIVVLTAGMDLVGINPFVETIVYGVVVIAAVAATIDRRRYGLIK